MRDYFKYLTSLFDSFHENGAFWNQQIAQANENLHGGNFEHVLPWFYNGELLNEHQGKLTVSPQAINKTPIWLENPKYANDPEGRLNHIINLHDFIQIQNTGFQPGVWYGGRTIVYDYASKLTSHLQHGHINLGMRYEYLYEGAICFDWIPFHSVGFNIRIENDFFGAAIRRNLAFFQECGFKAVIATGKNFISELGKECQLREVVRIDGVPFPVHLFSTGKLTIITTYSFNARVRGVGAWSNAAIIAFGNWLRERGYF